MTAQEKLDEISKYTYGIIQEVENDERYHYKPASIDINAPLALMQVVLETQIDIAKKIKAIINS